jgi:DNA polymerase-1
LDTETTGLNPRTDRVRLLQLAKADDVFIVDCFAVDPRPILDALKGKQLVVHNAAFDLAFLWRLGFRPAKVFDTMLMSRLLTAGTRQGNTLADVAQRYLGVTLDKTYQQADWSGDLSAEQLHYAAQDARITCDLYEPLTAAIEKAGLECVASLENRAVPAFVWLAATGAPFDAGAWETLTIEAIAKVAEIEKELNALAPSKPIPASSSKKVISTAAEWNWRSWQQVKAIFALLGIDLPSTGDEVLATIAHPLAALLRQHRHAAQLVKAFGRSWLPFVDSGRIYAKWNSLGTDAGRSSCKEPNLQQVPKRNGVHYRRCFVAPPGRLLVKADYSQLQLRIAAKIADEDKMIDALTQGADLYSCTAQAITGKAEVSKEDRQLAKVLNFGLLFGMGIERLREYARQEYEVELTEQEATQHHHAFFAAYPALDRWHAKEARRHRRTKDGRATQAEQESRTPLGRRRLLDAQTPLTFRLNSPVQGCEADGAKSALALLWERREECPSACPVLFVHDEIVIEVDEDKAEEAATWLKQAMVDAMQPLIDPVPCEVEVKTARTWGGE